MISCFWKKLVSQRRRELWNACRKVADKNTNLKGVSGAFSRIVDVMNTADTRIAFRMISSSILERSRRLYKATGTLDVRLKGIT